MKSRKISPRPKIKLYTCKSNIRSVSLYAVESWRNYKETESRVRVFKCIYLRMILGVRSQDQVNNIVVTKERHQHGNEAQKVDIYMGRRRHW